MHNRNHIFPSNTQLSVHKTRFFFLSVNSRSIIISSSYADDTTLFIKGNNLDDLIDFTNTELVKKNKWFCANKLSLSINKTAFSVCSTKSVTDFHRVNPLTPRRTLVAPFTKISILF